MEALLSLLNESTVINFLLLFARILAFMAFMPIFGHKVVNVRMRAALSFYVTLFLFPMLQIESQVTSSGFLIAILSEATLGLIASMLVNIIFNAVKMIGEFVGYATALSMASFFDPASGTNEGILARLMFYISLAVFFESGMYEMTFSILAKSFSIVHLGAFDIYSYDGIKLLIDEINRMFAFTFAFAFPLFFIGFVIDIYYAYGTKSMPAFSPFVITFQLKFALIMIFIMMGMEVFTEAFTNYFITKFQ
ncbi:type III secretion system inner membrane R protein [Arcobacter nitrofigilis DSM 7299]|uniref:Type III secretion system inner membrane R protein n=1 Tax=Arcobacter nitrofigilis (strain ATCC 33309 / DSM 7299 / CCUG 15893 / LMG 7604 / NCTC 12251 / CI) TaxID=572480 RepID=D5UZ77_ARCNC|nr:flagellar biosynthetic protein FliR [Arcobacter nitrofigilis]ADG94129.1 type III secretion system inner membrane R protein [Arcobacter nitrofigilis DSM 7299]